MFAGTLGPEAPTAAEEEEEEEARAATNFTDISANFANVRAPFGNRWENKAHQHMRQTLMPSFLRVPTEYSRDRARKMLRRVE